jgi:uncharacterized protein (DUF1015 family)
VTQPYDKITPEMQAKYYAASPFNLVRIILGKPQSDDTAQENVYSRAARSFDEWRRAGIFLQDRQPSIYTYAQSFSLPDTGAAKERRGFIALGRVEDYSAGIVFRHEQTLAKPKADRLNLLRSTRAHFGQIFMLYSDPKGEIDPLLATNRPPDAEVTDEYGVRHRLWQLGDPGLLQLVRAKMHDKKLIIADGHHRYETALTYRDERRTGADVPTGAGKVPNSGPGSELAPYEWVMMTFINMDAPGLVILPTHRVVHGLAAFDAETFLRRVHEYFEVEQVFGAVSGGRATELLRDAGQSDTAILAVTADGAFLLRARAGIGAHLSGFSARQQKLDVVRLHKLLLEQVLGISEEAIREQLNVGYLRDAQEAITAVREGASIAFLLNPVPVRQVREIAFAGEVLPQKSTDFYPKLLSGLTIYALE